MLRVALTGCIGSGKSAAAAILQSLGVPVSQSDEVARAMMQPGEPVFCHILERFGPSVLDAEGRLDRRKLARIAFLEERIEDLNAIVHPAVIAAQTRWMAAIAEADPRAVAVIESALVFETRYDQYGAVPADRAHPWRSRFDRVVLVAAPEALRLERYIERSLASDPLGGRGAIERDFHARQAQQMSQEQKTELSDVVVQNDGTLGQLKRSIASLLVQLRAEAANAS